MNNKMIWNVFIIFFTLSACGDKQEKNSVTIASFPVKKVEKKNITTYQEYAANLEGQHNVEIRPKVTGFIENIYVDEGQFVKKGTLLFKLETNTLSQDANAAKAAVDAAQVEVDRLQPLVERNIVSVVTLETAKTNLARAKANLSSIQANIGFATLVSPVDGVVGGLPFRIGSLVSPTMVEPLTTVSDIAKVRAYFTMSERQFLNFNQMIEGKNVVEKIKNLPEVELKLINNTIYDQKGKIETVNGMVNSRTGSIQFRAVFNNPKAILRSGGSGILRLPVFSNDVILVPQNAVFELQGKKMIYVVESDNTVVSKIIETNGTLDLDFIVIKGLEEGMIIVTKGASKLKEGQQIVPEFAEQNHVNE